MHTSSPPRLAPSPTHTGLVATEEEGEGVVEGRGERGGGGGCGEGGGGEKEEKRGCADLASVDVFELEDLEELDFRA